MVLHIKSASSREFKSNAAASMLRRIPVLAAPTHGSLQQKTYTRNQISASSISALPDTCAVYALYGGYGHHAYVAYVGNTRNLKKRIQQHLVSQDGGASTGTSAVILNPDHVTEVRWWRKIDFKNPQKRRAAIHLLPRH